jgi:translation initiation factor IF-2
MVNDKTYPTGRGRDRFLSGARQEVRMPEQEIGVVTHYFDRPQVAVVTLSQGEVAVGDTLRFHGHTTDFTETVASMEVDHRKVERAEAGSEVAIKVIGRARRHDKVFKVTD